MLLQQRSGCLERKMRFRAARIRTSGLPLSALRNRVSFQGWMLPCRTPSSRVAGEMQSPKFKSQSSRRPRLVSSRAGGLETAVEGLVLTFQLFASFRGHLCYGLCLENSHNTRIPDRYADRHTTRVRRHNNDTSSRAAREKTRQENPCPAQASRETCKPRGELAGHIPRQLPGRA